MRRSHGGLAMMRLSVSFVLFAASSLAFGPPTAAAEPAATVAPGEPTPAASASPVSLVSIVMGPPRDTVIGGWREIARAGHEIAQAANLEEMTIGSSGDLVVVGDRLVAVGVICVQDGGCRDVGWHSPDGTTWTEAPMPGVRPAIYDMTSRPDGSMAVAVGQTEEGRGGRGAVWSTSDGLTWASHPAPSVREVEWVAASDDVVVVAGGDHLWASTDLTTWRRARGPHDMPVAFGPAGFLAWAGGGQDLVYPTEVWRSADGLEWSRVRLPSALRRGNDAFGGIQVFPLDDGWLLIPDHVKLPKVIFTSSDGRRWRSAPRPHGMTSYVWWVDDIGEQAQAFGWLPDRRGQPSGMWTWEPGLKSGSPDAWRETRIGRPVEWHGERVALGEGWGDERGLILWRWEPAADETRLLFRGPP
jgi:hypothetical protein